MEIFNKKERVIFLSIIVVLLIILVAGFKLNYKYKEQIGRMEYMCLGVVNWELKQIVKLSEVNQMTAERLIESIANINTANIMMMNSPHLSFFDDILYRNIIDPANEVDLATYLEDNLDCIKKLWQKLNDLVDELEESNEVGINTYNYFNNKQNQIELINYIQSIQ